MQHSIVMYNPFGQFISYLRWKSIDVTLSETEVPVLTIALFPEYRDDYFTKDNRIGFLRFHDNYGVDSGKLVGDTMFLLKGRRRMTSQDGESSIVLICYHPNCLIKSRWIIADPGSAEADKTDLASEVLYAYLDENLGPSATGGRALSTSHFVLDTAGKTFGPTVDIAGAGLNLLDLVKRIRDAGASQGVYCGVEVYTPVIPGPFHLRIYSGQRGTDRGSSSGQTRTITPWNANMIQASMSEDWADVVSVSYAAGVGQKEERLLRSASDTDMVNSSPFGWTEHFEGTDLPDDPELDTLAEANLRSYRPRRSFNGQLSITSEGYQAGAMVYDENYTWGDILMARFAAPVYGKYGMLQGWENYVFDVRVTPVHIQVVRQYDKSLAVLGSEESITIAFQSVSSQ